jgi:hypothetical protein
MVAALDSLPKRHRRLLLTVLYFVTLSSWAPTALAASAADKGLSISPLYRYTTLAGGTSQPGSITVADLSSAPMTVILSVKQFSVTDYTYDYQFSEPGNNWLKLGQTQVTLQPGQSQQISYSLLAPRNTAPGGYYYTVFASAQLGRGGISATVQAATLLYVTVSGRLVKTGRLDGDSIRRINFGTQIPYSLSTTNTGNVYYFAYFSGSLHGMFTSRTAAATTHLLFPGKVRQIAGSIPSPVLPGVYKTTYGYRTDAGMTVMRTHRVIFIPPWSIAGLLLIILLARKIRRQHKKPTPKV